METMTFKRGAADIKACLNIGEIESLRLKLELLRNHPAVSQFHTFQKSIDNIEGGVVKVLNFKVDFTDTEEEYNHIDDFLIKYLDRRFFTGAQIEDNSLVMGISDYLGDLRQKPTTFTILLFIHPKYFNTFPDINLIWR